MRLEIGQTYLDIWHEPHTVIKYQCWRGGIVAKSEGRLFYLNGKSVRGSLFIPLSEPKNERKSHRKALVKMAQNNQRNSVKYKNIVARLNFLDSICKSDKV